MSIGSELDSGARDILVRNLTVDDTPSGVRTKSDVSRGGLVERVALWERVPKVSVVKKPGPIVIGDVAWSNVAQIESKAARW
ncbi:polygalacturonase [Bradyrhizobium niftali]|uniref:hypothetical protein n=1 Tax=Bradyrhizobium niftali TaxID=2560055 RepID=UPI0038383998